MKYSDKGFRYFYHQFILYPIEAAGSAVSDFGHLEDADSVLTYGYIDHETGMRFEIISTASIRNGGLQIYNDRPEGIRAFIKADVVNEMEGFLPKNKNDLYEINKELIDSLINAYEDNDEILKTREMGFLDEQRDSICIDDVQVILFRDGFQPESCWVRIEGLGENTIIGNLLNEPYQDFGYHAGDRVAFFAQKTEDGKVICVADMNPSMRITKEDLKGGQMLKDAIERFNSERNENNLFDVLELLRDSDVWVPCNAVLSDADQAAVERMVEEAGDDLSSMVGKTMTSQDQIRMIPDIFQNGDDFFFPVFSSDEEMGEYGNSFSKIETDFLHALNLARNNERKLKGIVVNAFSNPFVLDTELFDIVEKMKSRIIESEDVNN